MRHPLFDSLSAEEIRRVAAIVRGAKIAEQPGFAAVYTDEPDKRLLRDGDDVPRRARVLLVDRATGASYDVLVDLDAQTLVSSVADHRRGGSRAARRVRRRTGPDQEGPALRRGPRQARHHRPGQGADRPVGRRQHGRSRRASTRRRRAPAGRLGLLLPRLPRRQRLRAPDRGRHRGRRPGDAQDVSSRSTTSACGR